MANKLEQPTEFWEEIRDKFKELTLPDFRTQYKATVITTVWCWQGERIGSMEQIRVQKQIYTYRATDF